MPGGRFDFDDGGSYCGGWERGTAHGHGVCTGPRGQGEYSGAWSHGFEMVGVYTWPSGNTYRGYWAHGKRHGLGVELKGRWEYRGEWSHGFKGRYGVRQTRDSPARYDGTWNNGLQDGYGVETYEDGSTYQGQWMGGMRHGYGVRQSVPYGMAMSVRSPLRSSLSSLRSLQSNGVVLLQDVTSDPQPHTRGGFVLNVHGEKAKAQLFRRGSLFGSLRQLRKSESKSSISSKRSSSRNSAVSRISTSDTEGEGRTDAEDRTDTEDNLEVEDKTDATVTESYAGEWRNDKRSGFGVSERSDGTKYEGEWLNNRRHGYGCTVLQDGIPEEGKYKNNVLVRGIRRQLIPLKNHKSKAKVDRAAEGARRAAAVARNKVEIAVSRTTHARTKGEVADQAAIAADQESDLARTIATELAPDYQQPGLEYIKQSLSERVEEVQEAAPEEEEKKEAVQEENEGAPTPPPAKKNPQTGSGAARKLSVTREISRDHAAPPRRISRVEPAAVVPEVGKAQDAAPPKPPKINGQLHTAYHSYYVKTIKTIPPPEEPEDKEPEMTQSSLARMPPPPPKSFSTPTPKPESRPRSIKAKSLADTKKVSVEVLEEVKQEEVAQNSIVVVMVMLLNIGLAIIFVHFLT
ncbi:junctophilin-1a [Trichomycterus rosablanca]|uniref:junctophilin-1a n=1 Tax=Trichomycterus rosablanca TaxID=2290929 RepID=UPI002F34FE10